MGRDYKNISGENNPNYKTGFAVRGCRYSFYNTWQNMKARVNNPNHPKYHRYGGRGIALCNEWIGIEGFSKWALASGWKQGLSIDRIDNDGDYCPENCHWVTLSTNARKKSTTRITIEQAGVIRTKLEKGNTITALAAEFNVAQGTIRAIESNITHVAEGECTKMLKRNRDKAQNNKI